MRPNWKTLLGVAVVAALLWWLFRDADLGEVWATIRAANPFYLLTTCVVAMAGFAARAARWRFLLAPAQPGSPYRSRFAAVCVGFMANNLLPSGRVGELGRAYAYSRLEPVSTATAFATLVVERLLDGVAVFALLVIAVLSATFPAESLPELLVAGIQGLTLILGLVLTATLTIVAFPTRSAGLCSALAARVLPHRLATVFDAVFQGVVAGLASMRGVRHIVPALLWSFAVWVIQSLSFWIGFAAFGIDLPFAAALFTNAAIAVAVAVPAPPGYLGTFQLGATVALVQVYSVAEEAAIGFAVGWHFVNFFPVTIAGLWYARRIGITFKDFARRRQDPDGASVDRASPDAPTVEGAPR
ncbi:MAG: lysylphosphatidylglycerol synthase transmembrane domain-containing protein [Gemmatimonadota bacterium]|nr:lysylphosphatidylglycerol synthase transmembrane domain-containing protein [Gemmatimonadota bacterium]